MEEEREREKFPVFIYTYVVGLNDHVIDSNQTYDLAQFRTIFKNISFLHKEYILAQSAQHLKLCLYDHSKIFSSNTVVFGDKVDILIPYS